MLSVSGCPELSVRAISVFLSLDLPTKKKKKKRRERKRNERKKITSLLNPIDRSGERKKDGGKR